MKVRLYTVPWTQEGEDKFDMTSNTLESILNSSNCNLIGEFEGGITYSSSLTASINLTVPENYDIKKANYCYIPEKKEGWYLSDFRFMNAKMLTLSLEYDIWSNTFNWNNFKKTSLVNVQRQHADRFVNTDGYPMDFNQTTSKVYFEDEVIKQYGRQGIVKESKTLTPLKEDRFNIGYKRTDNFLCTSSGEYREYTIQFNPNVNYNDWIQEYVVLYARIGDIKYEMYVRIPKNYRTNVDKMDSTARKDFFVNDLGYSFEQTVSSLPYAQNKVVRKLNFNSMVKVVTNPLFAFSGSFTHTVGDRRYTFTGMSGPSFNPEFYIPVDCYDDYTFTLANYITKKFISQQPCNADDMADINKMKTFLNQQISATWKFNFISTDMYEFVDFSLSSSCTKINASTYQTPSYNASNLHYTSKLVDTQRYYPEFKYQQSSTYNYKNEPRIYLDDVMKDTYWANNISLNLGVYNNLDVIEILETVPVTNQEISITAISGDNAWTNYNQEYFNKTRSIRAGSSGNNSLPFFKDTELETLSRQKSTINNQAKWDAISGGLGGATQAIAGGGQMLVGALSGDAGAVSKGTANVMGGLINAITAPIRARQTKKATLNDLRRSPDEVSGVGGLIQINSTDSFKPTLLRSQLPDWAIESISNYFHRYGYKVAEQKTIESLSTDSQRKQWNYFEIEGMGESCMLNQTFKEYFDAMFSAGVRIWHKASDRFRDYTYPNNERFINND